MKNALKCVVAILLMAVWSQAFALVEWESGSIVQDSPWDRDGYSTLDDDTCVIDYTGMVNGNGNSGTIYWPGSSYSGPMGVFAFVTTCDPNPLYAYCVDLGHGLNVNPYCAVIYDTPINDDCEIAIPAMAYIMTWHNDTTLLGDDILQMALWKFNEDANGIPYYCPPSRPNEDSVHHSNPAVNGPANALVTLAAGETDGMPKNVILEGDTLTITSPGPVINGIMSDLVVDINLARGALALSLGNASVSGVKIILSTSEGTLSEDTVFTDEYGHAQVVVSNPIAEGLVPVTVMACTKGYWPREIRPCYSWVHSQGMFLAPFRTYIPYETCVELQDRFLAAELASFEAYSGNDGVYLSWRSASETNMDHWEVERRISGAAVFNRLATVPAVNQATGSAYQYVDRSAETGMTYDYRLVDVDLSGVRTVHGDLTQTINYSGGEQTLPETFYLADNYPNPFNPETKIRFSLPENGLASLKVYDAIGRHVATLVNGQLSAGEHAVTFNAENLPSGLYFYKLTAGGSSVTKKMILMK
ncbi:MAG: T9SS type A sorting domain-containing protein [Calditrichota bacterium]